MKKNDKHEADGVGVNNPYYLSRDVFEQLSILQKAYFLYKEDLGEVIIEKKSDGENQEELKN